VSGVVGRQLIAFEGRQTRRDRGCIVREEGVVTSVPNHPGTKQGPQGTTKSPVRDGTATRSPSWAVKVQDGCTLDGGPYRMRHVCFYGRTVTAGDDGGL